MRCRYSIGRTNRLIICSSLQTGYVRNVVTSFSTSFSVNSCQNNIWNVFFIAKIVNKPGLCPALANGTHCATECYDDSDCRGDNKCCVAGCSQVCSDPVNEREHPSYVSILNASREMTYARYQRPHLKSILNLRDLGSSNTTIAATCVSRSTTRASTSCIRRKIARRIGYYPTGRRRCHIEMLCHRLPIANDHMETRIDCRKNYNTNHTFLMKSILFDCLIGSSSSICDSFNS